MGLLQIKMTRREQLKYTQICSKLDELTDSIHDIISRDNKNELEEFNEEFESEIKTKKQFMAMLSERYKIPPGNILLINDGILFFKKH